MNIVPKHVITHNDDTEIIRNLFEVVNSENKFNFLRKNAVQTWTESRTYSKDMISNLQRLT